MTNNLVACQIPIPSNSTNEQILLQRSDLAYSINIYFKNREVNDDNVATFIKNIRGNNNVSPEDKAFVTLSNIKDIISVHSNFKIVDGHLEKNDDVEINYEEIKTREDHEQNMLMATDPAVIELFSNIPLCDDAGKPRINRFGTVLYHDYKEIWELLIYVANASSKNDTISFEDIIEGLKSSKIKRDYDLNPIILKDLLTVNEYNKFTELFTKVDKNFVITDNALVNKLLSGISKPITIFKNIEMLVENGSFFIKEFVTNSTNSTDEKKRRYNDAIVADKENKYFKVSISNEIIWNVDTIKELFTNTNGNYNITYQNALVLLKAIKVLKNNEEVNKNFREESSGRIIADLNSYFTEMFEAKTPDIRFKENIYNLSSIHAIIPKNDKKAALSFVTKTFKKMYAAVNLNHQIKMYRKHKQTHLHEINLTKLREELKRFKEEDPTLLHLPYIKLIELSGQSEFSSLQTPLKNILQMSKLAIIDTIVENGEAETVEDLSEETQLKWRLSLACNLKYEGNIVKDERKKNINSFSFLLPTNSSNKTVKVAEGFEYVTDIKNGKPVYAFDEVSINTTILANEFNRVVHYFNKLVGLSAKEGDTPLEATTKANNIKIYTENKVFEKALNLFFCVSNQLVEVNETFFISKKSAENNSLYNDMIKDIPEVLYKTLTKLPNLNYFDYDSGKLSLKSDVAIPKLSAIYQTQFIMEIKDLRKSIEKALLVDFKDTVETMSDMVQFIGSDILINTDSNLLSKTVKVEQLDSDIEDIVNDTFERYRGYAKTYIEVENKTYEDKAKENDAINRRARVEKEMRELHLLIEVFITAHNKQYGGVGSYSTTKGSSLNNFIGNIYKEGNEDSVSINQEILLAFNMYQERLNTENPGEPNSKAFNIEEYGIDTKFMSKYITLSDILSLIDRYNRLNKDDKLHVVLGKTDEGKGIVLKHASKEDFIKYGKKIYNKATSMMYYNTLLNLYDDLNLTVGDMISFYKKDNVTGWGVEATFTNLYKRLKMIISPTVPHAPYVIIPSMNKDEAGKKEFTFNNIVLKSNVTYSPQVRSTMISQNKSISDDTSDTSPTYSAKLLFAIFKDRADLIEKVNNKTLSLFEANGQLTVKDQDRLDKHFIKMYKANEKDIKNELKALGFDTSYFNIDMTDAFDIATLTFELKRAMLYNTNNSVIEQELYNLLYRWLHTPMSDKADDTVFIGNFNTGVKRLRKHTNYNLEEFERSLPSIELKKQYTDFIFYLRKDITVDFVRDPYLNNRMIFTDKNSSRVMLPTDIIGSPLNLLRLFMEVYEVDRMSHDSAIKMTSSTIYPIDFWSKVDGFKSEEEAFKFLYGETGGVIEKGNGTNTKLINNYVPIKWASIGEQVSQSQSPKSLIASQSKSLVYLNQKEVDFDTLYYNGEQVTVKKRKERKGEKTTTIKGIELYEKQQIIWKQIYYSRYREFTDDVFVDGIVNTEKLREFIIDSFQDTDKLKYNDLLSLNTNIFKVEETLKEKINNSEKGSDIRVIYEGILATIKDYSSKDINKRTKEELEVILDNLVKYEIIPIEDSRKENFLFEYVLPLFYNTNSTKIETLFTSMINNLLRIKTTGIKGALTPNVDTVKTSFITEDMKSSMVLVDPNDWTPDLHLRSTVYAESKIHSDEIATSWNFTGEVKNYFLFDGENFIPSNDHYGNISRKTVNTETFSIKDLGEKVKTSKNSIVSGMDAGFIEMMSSTFNGYSPKIHSKMVIHYGDKESTQIIGVSFIRKEKGILDILDYCKPEKHEMRNDNNNKAISYPVLDLERLPKKILQGFANRIPTQSPNSMSFFKVVAFFHGGTKSTIAAPAEFIVRMGSDFDIDTLYSFIYNFYYDKSDKTFSFSEFTEDSDALFDLWLVKNRLKKSLEKPNLLQLNEMYKTTSEEAQKEIMKELKVLAGMLKNNENFQSTGITKNDSFNEIVDKVIAYEEEVKAEIKTLKDSGDTEGAKNVKRNKLYLYKKHTKLSDCIDLLFDEGDYLRRKVALKIKFLEEYTANPNMIYELNEEKAVYNRLTDNYISVMSNPRNIESILAPLDFGISEGSGDKTTKTALIEALKLDSLTLGVDATEKEIIDIVNTFNKYGLAQIVSLLKQDDSFTYNPLTLLTNYRKYVAASSSKKGIGWAALHQVFTTVVELKGKGVKYIPFESMKAEDIATLTLFLKTFTNVNIDIPTDLSMSGINTNGKIAIYTGKGQDRSTFVSIFVDDETKQFAAKLNMVAFTFSALAGYNVLGYDFTYYSLLLSNPIIKRLENLKTFYKNRDKTAYLHLFYELGLEDNIIKNPSNSFEPYSLIETDTIKTFDDYMHNLYKKIKDEKEFSSDVKDLLVLLNSNDTSGLANNKKAGMLLSFYMADKLGKIWGEYAVLMNKDASGISALYSKVVNQYEDLSDLFKNKNVQNILETFGSVDFLLYSPYLPSKVITTDNSIIHPNPYEIIKYIKEYDDIFTTRPIIKLTGIEHDYLSRSLRSDMSIRSILDFLINDNTKEEWKTVLRNKTLGNTFLNTLLLIYAEKHGTNYTYKEELIDLIVYLMKPQRFNGIKPISDEFIAELTVKDEEDKGKGYKGFKDVYDKLLEYNTYIVNDNILFEATSHKGYALGAIQLTINTYHKYFPYATNLWKEYEKLYRMYEGKSLSYEDAMSNYTKLFKSFQILSNMYSDSEDIFIASDKAKGLLMLTALKSVKAIDNPELASKYYFLKDIDISISDKDYVVISYTAANSIVSEAVTDVDKIERYRIMLKDDTPISDTGVTIKELATYLATYYIVANGATYSSRNLGSLIPSTYIQNLNTRMSFDFDSEDTLSTSQKFDFLLFMFTHNPSLFMSNSINPRSRKDFDTTLYEDTVVVKQEYKLEDVLKKDLLYSKKEGQLYFNIMSVARNMDIVKKILDLYYHNDSNKQDAISYILNQMALDKPPVALYVKLNNFMYNKQGVTIYNMPVAEERRLLLPPPINNKSDKLLEMKEKKKKVLVSNKGLTIIENAISDKDCIDIIANAAPVIGEISFKQTKGSTSFSYGLEWIRLNAINVQTEVGKNIARSIKTGQQLNGKTITTEMIEEWITQGEKLSKKKLDEWLSKKYNYPLYVYTALNRFGNPLPQIPQIIIDKLSKLGIDVSQYEASYNSIYDKKDNGFLIIHQDNTEQTTDPIITISTGRAMKFIIYQLKDSTNFNIASSLISANRMVVNTIAGEIGKYKGNNSVLKEAAKYVKKDAKDNYYIEYGYLTPTKMKELANEIDNANSNVTSLHVQVSEIVNKLFDMTVKKEYKLSAGTVLVFAKDSRNVFHEIVYDKSYDEEPMPTGYPTLSVNKAFSSLGHPDRFENTSDYRGVFTLRRVTPSNVDLDVIDYGKLLAENKSDIVLPIFMEEQSGTTTSEMYRNRTIKNAQADATIHLAVDFTTPGEILTKNQVNLANKQYIALDAKNLAVTKERVDTIVNKLNAIDTPITGINIKSDRFNANSLGNKLTNKSESLPSIFNVEEAYKAEQSINTQPQLNPIEALRYDMNLMYRLQVEKFRQNPELIDEINTNGGLEFITSSSHWTRYTDDTYSKLDKDKTSFRNKNDRWIGEGLDSNFIKVLAKSYTKVAKELGKFKQNNKEIILNIAGNGIYSMPNYTQEQIDAFTYELIKAIVNSPNIKVNITLIRSGGQSGFDEAGIKAGMKLGIPTFILAPKKWQYMIISDGKNTNIVNEDKFKERFQPKIKPTNKDNVIAFANDYANTLEKGGKSDKAFNIRKDIKMMKKSDGFIGKVVPETSPLYDSATEKYRINWRDSANPATFDGMESVMISGSGTWNTSVNGGKITMENIQNHFDTFYKPLIDKAINEGVTIFNVGIANGMDKVVYNYLVDIKGFKPYPQSDKWVILKLEKGGNNTNTKIETPTIIGLDLSQRFTRKSVEIDKDYLYLFTDNATRTSGQNPIDNNSWYSDKYGQGKKYPGTTQAVARGLDNAFPITTMVDANYTQWTDDKFDEYKAIIDDEIATIIQAMSGYKGIKFGAEMPFGKGNISKMDKAPKIWNYLNEKLKEIGIDNTGIIPKVISVSDSESTETGLTAEQEAFAKKNTIEQNFYHKKPYPKEIDSSGKVTKWNVYKSKTGQSSMQAALEGNRTETTRSISEINKLKNLAINQGINDGITGTIIWMKGQVDNIKDSTNIKGGWFKITSEPYSPNQEDFNNFENWEDNVWNDRNSEFKIGTKDEWKSVRFERLPVKSTDTTSTAKNTTLEKEISILKKLGKTNLESIVKNKDLHIYSFIDAKNSIEELKKDLEEPDWAEFDYDTFINTVNVIYKLKLENLKIVTVYTTDTATGKEIEKKYSLPEFIKLITPEINAIDATILSPNQLSLFDSNINQDVNMADEGNFTTDEIKEKMKEPYKGFENFLWYYIAEKAKEYAPEKYNSIVNAKDYHTAYLIGANRMKAYNNGNASTPGIQDPDSKVWDRVLLEFVNSLYDVNDDTEIEDIEYEDITPKTANYKYYGAWYSIVLDDKGNGINILNYKGKPATKAKLLGAFNANPTLEVQNNTTFDPNDRPSQSDTTTDEEIPEVDEDTPPNKSKYTFAYKGKEIETHFQLSPDQENVLKQLIDFTQLPVDFKDSKTQRIMVQGAAGVGKTGLIGYLQKYLEESILYTAPTHAATLQLAYATMMSGNRVFPATVASSLKYDEYEKKYTLSKKALEKIGFGRIIVVDETSMLNSDDYDKLIKLLSSQSYKIIFVGDKKQIPEVMTGSGVDFKNVSKAFTENTVLNLDTIHRTSNINIKQVLQKTRDSVHFQCYKITENTDSLAFHKDAVEFKSVVRKLMKAYPLDTDYITYTNAGVRANNKAIREGIFNRRGEIQVGDIVMGYLGYQSKQIEKGHLANSVTYKVEKVTKSSRGYSIELSSDKLDYLRDSGYEELPDIIRTTYVPLSKSDVIFNTMTEEELENNNMFLSSIFLELYTALNKAKKAVRGTAEFKAAWREYFKIEGEVSDTMAVNDLGDNYIYNFNTNRMELYESDIAKRTKEQKTLISAYGKDISKFVVEKGIDFGHAITIHKSQGRSTKHVLFDGSSVPENRDTIIKENGKQISTERQALSYVGLSRASESLDVLEGNFNYIALPTLKEDEADNVVSKLTGDNASFGKNKDC